MPRPRRRPGRGSGRHHGGYPGHSPENFRGALREVWFAPRRFFRRLDPEAGLIRPALFAVVVLFAVLLVETLLRAVWGLGAGELNYALLYAPLVGLVVAGVLAPFLVGGFALLVLVVLGVPFRRGFGPLFRALAYATGVGIVLPVPYGPVLALPYGAYVATVAVKETLGVDWRRAAIGTLVPLGALALILFLLTGPDEALRLLINPPGT